jgi:hypothetical protein
MSRHSHEAAIQVDVPAAEAFAYLADGLRQGDWTLGSWNRRAAGEGIFAGTSLFDGSELLVRLIPHEDLLLVVYEVGHSPSDLRPLVWARVVPGPVVGLDEGSCVVTLVVWRGEDVGDDTWELLGHTFATEAHMIKGRLELGFEV